jgi:acyl-coenzyme A synthetase/AMP-(fatty) acid ligase
MLSSERLREHAQKRGDQVALISPRGALTYRELAQAVHDHAVRLRALGLGPNAILGISLGDEHDHYIASLALFVAGLNQVTLATSMTLTARAVLAAKVGVTHILSDDAAQVVNDLPLLRWAKLSEATTAEASASQQQCAGALYITATGTTGDANTIVFSEQQIAQQAERHANYADERLLRLAPIEFNTSKRHRLYCFWQGGANVFRPPGSLAAVVAFIAQHGVTCLDVSYMHLSELLALGRPLPSDVKLRPGGAPVPAQLRRIVRERVTANLYVRYAATECGAIAMAGPADHDDDASCGRPIDGVEVEVVDEARDALPVGVSGELRIRASGMAEGYLANAEASQARFRDGWFYPGDIGYVRNDGCIVLQGRADDVINLNGVKILPSEIERVLEGHPSVAGAAALALASPVHGEIPVAAVELVADAKITPASLLVFARERLAIKAPRKIIVLGALPRNEQGKILKRELRRAFDPA